MLQRAKLRFGTASFRRWEVKRDAVTQRLDAADFAVQKTFTARVLPAVVTVFVVKQAQPLIRLVTQNVFFRRDAGRVDSNKNFLSRSDKTFDCAAAGWIGKLVVVVDLNLREFEVRLRSLKIKNRNVYA